MVTTSDCKCDYRGSVLERVTTNKKKTSKNKGGQHKNKCYNLWPMMLRFMTAKSQFQCAIHHNKKDGGMLIVKTVFREFALPACNDSFKISCHVNLFKIGCLFMLIYSFFVANKNKNCCNLKDIDMSISPIEVHNFDRGRCFANKNFHGKEGKFG